ncbi:hypothetical protein GGR95_000952 [Sulfitobacter undariae]|uniref:Uncharacterized protein n=1 Tax=Sulfitobacter undariae TaxID=1563671 RepID=A0A7W6E2Z1_9RHOB|nr:hypothetical protein [Sulfitobacter undariae]MBB3993324.1 hypothetical protein [Sulfitobacter undariae]
MIRKILMASVLFVAACTTPQTSSYTLPPEDRAAISTRIANFEQAFVRGNTTEIVNIIPPRMIATIAKDAGVPEPMLRRELAKLTRETTRDVKILSFGMSLENATFRTTPTGRPYGLIPTQTVIRTAEGQKLQSNNQTLTLEDGDKWYLIRIDDARQVELMRKVYPDFKDVTFPKGTSKVIK